VVSGGVVHFFPHPPQLATSEAVLVSQPLPNDASQSAHPDLQEAISQMPSEHPGVPLGTEQVVPQPPQ
jgi:hypothetical protein